MAFREFLAKRTSAHGVSGTIAGEAAERQCVNFAFLAAAGPVRQVRWTSAARPAPLLLAAGFPDAQAPAALRLAAPRDCCLGRKSGSEASLARRCLARGEGAATDACTLASSPKRRRLDVPDMGPAVAALLRQVGQGAAVSQVCFVARACVQAGRSKSSPPLPRPPRPPTPDRGDSVSGVHDRLCQMCTSLRRPPLARVARTSPTARFRLLRRPHAERLSPG